MFRLLFSSLLLLASLTVSAREPETVPGDRKDTIPIAKIPDIPPAERGQFSAAFRRGVDFLLEKQNRDGSWGDHRVIGTWNISLPLSGTARSPSRRRARPCAIAGLNATPLRDDQRYGKP